MTVTIEYARAHCDAARSTRSCSASPNGGTSKSCPRRPGRYASGKQTTDAPRAEASDTSRPTFSNPSSSDSATRGDARAIITYDLQRERLDSKRTRTLHHAVADEQ